MSGKLLSLKPRSRCPVPTRLLAQGSALDIPLGIDAARNQELEARIGRAYALTKLGLKNIKAITRITYTKDEPGLSGKARVLTL